MENDLISRKELMDGRVGNDPVRIAAMCADPVNAVILPCKVGGVVLVDSRTLPTHRLDVDEEEMPEYFKATVVSIRQNSKGWFFKLSILAKWLTPVWDDECGSYEIGLEKMRYFTYHASAIGKTVFLSHEEAEAALAERNDQK